ncbi:MAG TPA: PQQ-binding-like beta-propeller repeat protein [Bryobacteraceae bacterium]|nr:PQQ-binding-like beta-propeller repeat protein [Bryobacteraceae bacterium]
MLQLCTVQASEQPIFAAREFLLTRQFTAGLDVYPTLTVSPMATHAGDIYLAGAFKTSATEYKTVLRKFDASGSELWTQEIPAPDNAFPDALVADPGGVYIAMSVGSDRREPQLRKYGIDGKELWSRELRISETGHHVVAGLAIDDLGLYIAAWDGLSQGIVRRYSLSGTKLWTRTMTATLMRGVATDGNGVYVAGRNNTEAFVRKFAATGSLLWTRPLIESEDQINSPAAVAAGPTGVYVGGSMYRRAHAERTTYVYESREGYVEKLDGDGGSLWRRRFGPAGTGVEALVADSTGIYATGGVKRTLPGQCRSGAPDVFVRSYDVAGNEQWTRQFGTARTETAGSVAVDKDALYVSGSVRGGTTHGSLFLAKLAKTPSVQDTFRPRISWECVLNAANYAGGAVSPGEIVNIFGVNMGPAEVLRVRSDAKAPTSLGDVRVLFDGVAAPLLFVSATQVNAIVPDDVARQSSVVIEVEHRGVRSQPLTLPVAPTHPGVFTSDGSGEGPAVILNEDGSINSPQNLAERNSVLTFYVTGAGLAITPRAKDILVFFADPRNEDTMGTGSSAEVISASSASGGVAGLLEIKVRAPEWALTGPSIAFDVQIGSAYTDLSVTVALR